MIMIIIIMIIFFTSSNLHRITCVSICHVSSSHSRNGSWFLPDKESTAVTGLGAEGQSRKEAEGLDVSMCSCTRVNRAFPSMRSSTFTGGGRVGLRVW